MPAGAGSVDNTPASHGKRVKLISILLFENESVGDAKLPERRTESERKAPKEIQRKPAERAGREREPQRKSLTHLERREREQERDTAKC